MIFSTMLLATSPQQMNPHPYRIANPAPNTSEVRRHRGEFFDVYGEVQTRYSQVYWTRNAPIALPPALVERFKGGWDRRWLFAESWIERVRSTLTHLQTHGVPKHINETRRVSI